jgi:hypothetical protein
MVVVFHHIALESFSSDVEPLDGVFGLEDPGENPRSRILASADGGNILCLHEGIIHVKLATLRGER